ncbi:hypothetical protein FM996_14610 [Methylosinus sporium]|uniref:Uncharacterized protein n=1 Tax=Methylosinus sporium TaxID=428 RepID=A0A549SN72_METSR|nr:MULTISPECIES: hypothetical protein [Methylosinus]MBU3890968.1 hypothetical protein [Methylosinus sp. KRF6]TRL31082.1 hypothetical protein FM996_14610 [Methylosinus sporium]
MIVIVCCGAAASSEIGKTSSEAAEAPSKTAPAQSKEKTENSLLDFTAIPLWTMRTNGEKGAGVSREMRRLLEVFDLS